MGQVTIYLDANSETRLRKAAAKAGVPLSRWVSKLVQEKTRTDWPESVRRLAGAWRKDLLKRYALSSAADARR